MKRDSSALFNVFRFLDRQKLLPAFLSQLSGKQIDTAELILWSYSPHERSDWSLLDDARLEFGETIARGSEPDIIILTDKILYFIEAKLSAKNETRPSDITNRKEYETEQRQKVMEYFRNKTIGYNSDNQLVKAFYFGSYINHNTNYYL